MSTINYSIGSQAVDSSLDGVVIVKTLETAPIGGGVLDVADFSGSVLKAGHVIIRKSNGAYAPMPVSGDAYASLPSGAKVFGILYATIRTAYPEFTAVVRGTINVEAAPYAFTDAIKQALPLINFTKE